MTDTTVEVGQSRLSHLAALINEKTRKAEHAARSAVENAMAAGELLTRAKKEVPHGEWGQWIALNCEVSARTAQAYMALSRRMPMLSDAEAQRVADLPLREAVKAIGSSPTAPTPAVRNRRVVINDRERAATAMKKAADSIREGARLVKCDLASADKIATMRRKLQSAIEMLDRIREGGEA